MTTELTLRQKAMGIINENWRDESRDTGYPLDRIADLLSATGAPAYIRVADDLRGVVREEEGYAPSEDGKWWARCGAPHPGIEPRAYARYLGQFDKRGGE